MDHAFKQKLLDFDDFDSDNDGVCDIEVRDAFLEFMSKILQDYKKFFKDIH